MTTDVRGEWIPAHRRVRHHRRLPRSVALVGVDGKQIALVSGVRPHTGQAVRG